MNGITEDVIIKMSNDLNVDQLNKLKLVLSQVLSDYNVTPKPHDLVTYQYVNSQALMKFLAWKSTEGKKPSTARHYNFIISKTLEVINKSIYEITEDDLFLYIASQKQKGLSNTYLQNIRMCLSSFFTWLHDRQMITANPIVGISSIKCEKKIKKSFSDVDMDIMRKHLNNERDIALFETLYATGCRVSELCNLNISSVDFNSGTVKVLGKGSKERIVFLSDVAKYHLRLYLDSRHWEEGPLFLGRRHTRLQPCAVEDVLRKLGERSGIEKVHPHRFRRTLATNLLKKGMPIEEVSEILGHSNIDTTLVYCNLDPGIIQTNYSRMMTV